MKTFKEFLNETMVTKNDYSNDLELSRQHLEKTIDKNKSTLLGKIDHYQVYKKHGEHDLFLIYDEDKLICFFSGSIYPLLAIKKVIYELDQMIVKEDYRGNDLSGKLMSFIIKDQKKPILMGTIHEGTIHEGDTSKKLRKIARTNHSLKLQWVNIKTNQIENFDPDEDEIHSGKYKYSSNSNITDWQVLINENI
jgi:hypothetical protein